MNAFYDSEANAISITLAEVPRVDRDVVVHPCGTVALVGGRPVGIELLDVRSGIDDAVHAVQQRFGLDSDALRAAAEAALAVPGRPVEVNVLAPMA